MDKKFLDKKNGGEMVHIAKIRYLQKGEAPELPRWARLLPRGLGYLEKRCPFRLEWKEGIRMGVLQTEAENGMTAVWRKNGASLLETLRQAGTEIVIPVGAGEWERGILPFADGRRLTMLFAFAGAAEALRRMGKEAAACRYLICGGTLPVWQVVTAGMENVNRLSLFTQNTEQAQPLVERLYAEQGLLTEVFSSPKNPLFREADAIICCGMEQYAYEHMAGEGVFWLDAAGNRPALRRLAARTDMAVADGFFFHYKQEKQTGRLAEATAFLQTADFRAFWQEPMEAWQAAAVLDCLREKGYALSGFSLCEKRVKIWKKA